MADCPIHHFENDIGKSIEFVVKTCDVTQDPPVLVPVDVSSATAMPIVFKRPDGVANLEVSGEFLTDGTDSIIRYQTVDGDLTPIGDWEGQLNVTLDDGSFYTTIIEFEIEAHL